MESKPVRRYPRPRYPTRLEVAARPGLLRRHQPPAWRQWPELTGAVGLFLLADTALLRAANSPPKNGPTRAQTNAVAVVAPIFQHGEGRGATGCIVMSPPVFLSEEEALQVVREELAAKGVQLGTNKVAVAGVPAQSDWIRSGEKAPRPFESDAADAKKKVFVEFVSDSDARDWDLVAQLEARPNGPIELSTVKEYDLPKTSAFVASRVKRRATDKVHFGTFYDPVAGRIDYEKLVAQTGAAAGAQTPPAKVKAKAKSIGSSVRTYVDGRSPQERMEAQAKAESRRLLRLQVRDFLKWLQAQGAI